MSTNIKYSTYASRKSMTAQQANQADEYNEEYYEDGILRKIITRSWRGRRAYIQITWHHFIHDSAETPAQALQNIITNEEVHRVAIYFNKQTAFGCTYWESKYYNHDGLPLGNGGGHVVYDSQWRELAGASFRDNGEINSGRKYMYFQENNPTFINLPPTSNGYDHELVLTFIFSKDSQTGILRLRDISDDGGRFSWTSDTDIETIQDWGLWDDYSYFHDILPLLPESEIYT